jgi:hypothetical protein
MKLMPEDHPDDPILLKQMLLDAQEVKEAYATNTVSIHSFFRLRNSRSIGALSGQLPRRLMRFVKQYRDSHWRKLRLPYWLLWSL